MAPCSTVRSVFEKSFDLATNPRTMIATLRRMYLSLDYTRVDETYTSYPIEIYDSTGVEDIVEGRGKRGARPMRTFTYPLVATARNGGLWRFSPCESQGPPESNEMTGRRAEIVTPALDCKWL